MGNPIKVSVGVNQTGFQALQRMDTDKSGKLNLAEVKAAADTDGDGKVGLKEAAALEEQLGRYMDKNLASKIAEASMGFEPLEVSFKGPDQAPAPAAAPPAAPAPQAQQPVKIPGTPGNVRSDAPMEIQNTPADPPQVLRSETPGKPVQINLADGVTVSQWPPAPATFKDPETGKEINGFKIELSTGDVMLVPQGQEVRVRDPQDKTGPGAVMIGGQEINYRIDTTGRPDKDVMTMRYATVFCTRNF